MRVRDGLTGRQRNVLVWLRHLQGLGGRPPRLDSLKIHAGLPSVAAVREALTALQKKGLVAKVHNFDRGFRAMQGKD